MQSVETNSTVAPQPRLGLSRTNWVLAGLLILQIILIAVVNWPHANAGGNAPLLGATTAAGIQTLSLADAEGHTVGLERDGDGWVLRGTDGYPANASKVDQAIDKLLSAKTGSLVTRTPASHRQLQVADDAFNRRITLAGPDGEQILYLGTPGGGNAYHIRLNGDDSTWLTSVIAPWELETAPGSWVAPQYFSVVQADIISLTLTNPNGTLKLERQDDGSWTLGDLAPGEQVAAANVDSFLSQVATVNLSTPLSKTATPEYGMDQPQAVVEMTTRSTDGVAITNSLQLGAKDEAAGTYYFKASTSPWYVTVAAGTGDAILQKLRADFLVPPPTSTPAAESNPIEQAPALATPLASPLPTSETPSD